MNIKNIREEFPIVRKYVYLDSACQTLKPKQVINKVSEYYNEYPACAGRSGHTLSNRVNEEVYKAREAIARLFSTKKDNVIFTRNTTEAINLVANTWGEENIKKGKIRVRN